MENENIESEITKKDNPYAIPIAIVIAAAMLSGALVVSSRYPSDKTASGGGDGGLQNAPVSELERAVLPEEGVTLPVLWGDLGLKLVSVGAIDADKFKAIYEQRGAFTEEYKNLLL